MKKRSGSEQLTLSEMVGFGKRGQARARLRDERANVVTTKAPSEPQMPRLPDLDMLTISDRQKVTAAAGYQMPMPEGAYGPQPDAFLSKQLSDRYLEDARRYRGSEQKKRAAELRPGAFRGEVASAADVRRRAGDLGLDPHALQYLAEPSRPLPPPTARDAGRAVVSQADNDHEVARRVHNAMSSGQSIDARKLSAGELRALLEIRGVG